MVKSRINLSGGKVDNIVEDTSVQNMTLLACHAFTCSGITFWNQLLKNNAQSKILKTEIQSVFDFKLSVEKLSTLVGKN
jgi:hypothetical protein